MSTTGLFTFESESTYYVSGELWDKVIGVNQKGPFRLTSLLGHAMKENGGGSIINISSVAGESGGASREF